MKNMKETKTKKAKNPLNATDMLLVKEYRPLSSWNYFGRIILYAIPVIGWIFMVVHAFASKSRHGRCYASGCILLTLLVLAGAIAAGFAVGYLGV